LAIKLPTITEAEFLAQVLQLAKLCGWLTAHFRPAKTAHGWRTAVQGDGAGWPDLVLLRGPADYRGGTEASSYVQAEHQSIHVVGRLACGRGRDVSLDA
jgi:hypothetical protein